MPSNDAQAAQRLTLAMLSGVGSARARTNGDTCRSQLVSAHTLGVGACGAIGGRCSRAPPVSANRAALTPDSRCHPERRMMREVDAIPLHLTATGGHGLASYRGLLPLGQSDRTWRAPAGSPTVAPVGLHHRRSTPVGRSTPHSCSTVSSRARGRRTRCSEASPCRRPSSSGRCGSPARDPSPRRSSTARPARAST